MEARVQIVHDILSLHRFMIFSHCIEFVFCFVFQPELLVDKVDSFLLPMHPFYLSFLEFLYCLVVSLSLSIYAVLGWSRKQVETSRKG